MFHHPIRLLTMRGSAIRMHNSRHPTKHIRRIHTSNLSKHFNKLNIGSGAPHMKLPEIVEEYDLPLPPVPTHVKPRKILRPLKFKK